MQLLITHAASASIKPIIKKPVVPTSKKRHLWEIKKLKKTSALYASKYFTMRKMRLIGIIGAILVIVMVLILKAFHLNSVFAIPFLLPFLVMILIDISGRKKTP